MSELKRSRSGPLFLLAALALFTLLGSRGLNEPDEGRYAEIGREMAATGEWLVPHLNGFEHFQKPPMLYWATASAIRILGANEWGARLPSALAALATVLLTAWIGRTLFNRRAGYLAGLILLSSLGFFVLARLLTPDMLLTFWITAALACFVRYAYCHDGKRWAFLFFAALGCGFLTKGPMALVVPLCAVAAWQMASRRLDTPPMPWFTGLLLTFAVGLSWFVALAVWRQELFTYFWRYELVERFASSHHGRAKPFWFFIPVILAAASPWIFLLPGMSQGTWRRWREGKVSIPGWLLFGWTIPPFLILSLSGSKLPTYILPLLPALALGFASYVTREERTAPWVPRLAFGTLLVGLALTAVVPAFNDRFGAQASLRDLIRPVAANPEYAHSRVCAVEVRCHGLDFYLRRYVTATREQSDLVLTPTPAQEQRLLYVKKFSPQDIEPATGEPPVLVVVRQRRAQKTFPPAKWSELGRAGDFVLLRSAPAVVPP